MKIDGKYTMLDTEVVRLQVKDLAKEKMDEAFEGDVESEREIGACFQFNRALRRFEGQMSLRQWKRDELVREAKRKMDEGDGYRAPPMAVR